MVIWLALRIPEHAMLLTVTIAFALLQMTGSASIMFWLFAEDSIVSPSLWTLLPADRTDSVVAFFAQWVAKSATFFFAVWTFCSEASDSTTMR